MRCCCICTRAFDRFSAHAEQVPERPRVAVVTTLGCPYCKKAKAALQAAGVPYEELELSGNLAALNRIKQLTGQTTVPQVRRPCLRRWPKLGGR